MNSHTKILFISNKWSAENKKYGLSEWEAGMQNSLQSTNLADFDVFHFDDHFFTTGVKGDEALLQKIAGYKPDAIYIITNKLPGTQFNVLEFSTLERIKNEFKIPIVFLFGDLAVTEQVKISLAVLPYSTLIVATELTAALSRIGRPDKYIYTWVPKDPRIFNNPGKERDIDIGYLGSPRRNRLSRILYLIKHGIKVVYGGGEGQEHLTTEQYADRYQRSKIALSFARCKSSHAILARPFEAMTCGAMVLEQESFETMKLYTPYVDYVPYTSKRDMLKKAKYYLEHDEERERIARSGQKKTEELYSAKRFWQIVIDRALGINSGEKYEFAYEIPQESLSHLSPFTSFKMRFLNSLCSTNAGFWVYRMFNWRYWQELVYITIAWFKPLLERLMPNKLFRLILKIKRRIIKTD